MMKNGRFEKTWRVYLIPAAMALVLLPLMAGAQAVRRVTQYAWLGWQENTADIFLQCKATTLYVIMGIILFFALCFWLLRRNIFTGTKPMILLLVYYTGTFLSTVLAASASDVWKGVPDRFEPFPVLVGYGMLFYYTYAVLRGEKGNRKQACRCLLRLISVVSIAFGILGCSQFFGMDLLTHGLLAKLCGMEGAEAIGDGRIYLTLYHPDYVGVMMDMLIPMNFAAVMTERTKAWRAAGIAALVCSVGCLAASQARTSLFLLVPVLVFALIFFKKKKGTEKKTVFLAGGFCVVLCLLLTAVDFWQDHQFSSRLFDFARPVRKEAIMMETGKDGVSFSPGKANQYKAVITGQGAECKLHIKDAAGREQKPGKGALAKVTAAKESVTYRKKKVYGYTLAFHRQVCFFTNQLGDSRYYYLNSQGIFDTCVLSEDAFPESFYGFASFRGFIWSKTIPLLKNSIFRGAGPNNFQSVFPHNDYSSRYLARVETQVYVKPHNWFLQLATESGLVPALCLLAFVMIVLVGGLRCGRKKMQKGGDKTAAWLLCGSSVSVLLYVLTGFFNDSMIVTSPVFWVLLGINYALQKAEQK